MERPLKKIWGRAGVSFQVTDEEAAAILDHEANDMAIAQIMSKVVNEGRFTWDGNSYIPAECITEFNKEYGTAYDDDGEPEWDF